MAFQKIPLRSDLDKYSLRVDLDGKVFTLSFNYHQRMDRWYMNILDENDIVLLRGVKMVLGLKLANKHKNENFPEGDLFLFDTSGSGVNPGLEDFGKRVILMYNTAT
jgi:hypothetical protein